MVLPHDTKTALSTCEDLFGTLRSVDVLGRGRGSPAELLVKRWHKC